MANRSDDRNEYPQGRWSSRRGDEPRMSDRYREDDDERDYRFGDRGRDERRMWDQDEDRGRDWQSREGQSRDGQGGDRQNRGWQGGSREMGDMRRREWDPGNYGGLDRERGPGQSGGGSYGYGMSGGLRGSQSAGSSYGGWDADPWSSGGRFAGGMGQGAGLQPQREAGPHRGKGPKGYTRSDDRIREDVSDRLSDDDMIDASEISIEVSGGEVSLEGTVSSREARRAAEDCVERCSGVTHVQNNLRVRDSAGTGSTGQSGQNTAQKARTKEN
ncbi:osmotic sensory protein [Gemmobacter lanyuensis]|uniref:Osmotic sensory protein n=1 Tax=Gemmobacter lanyuensis TaxID=1054497 RepID=A0A918MNW7_9RHOB|nr:BON domain-containing protein [Gemmobacter lanyuensis]GGW42760.1 osmotic sensory protein [Gemmobacter lanyuensis]